MNRRDLLKLITTATGVAFVGGKALAYETLPVVPLSDTGFTKDDVAFFNEIGEVIIPRTDTPGAKDADVGNMMAVLVADCYHPSMQKAFKEGLVELKTRSNNEYGKDFLLLSDEQKMEFLTTLDVEARGYNEMKGLGNVAMSNPNAGAPWEEELVTPHYFSLIKQLVLFSFFTSQVGATKVLRYVAVPTKYVGDLPYKKGDKAWAT